MNEIAILCTCESADQAERIARELVDQQLAACVNILQGVRSIYRWQGKVEDAAEILLIIKSRNDLFDAIQAAVVAMHYYDVPELIAMPITQGSKPYLDWLNSQIAAR